jgi:hypothetical protein
MRMLGDNFYVAFSTYVQYVYKCTLNTSVCLPSPAGSNLRATAKSLEGHAKQITTLINNGRFTIRAARFVLLQHTKRL